jgi:hypothetical protein
MNSAGNHAVFRIGPARQGLRAHDVPGQNVDLRLIKHLQFPSLDRAAKAGQQIDPVPGHLREIVREHADGPAPFRLGLMHRGVDVLQNLIRGLAMLGKQRHSDAGTDMDLRAVR